MFSEVIYDDVQNIYQSVYKAKDERTAKWIAGRYDNIDMQHNTFVFAYKSDVVISSKSEEIAHQLRDRLDHELAAFMVSIQEVDSDYRAKERISCEVNNVRLSKR